jgi:Helix-turn-helix domain
MRNHNERQPLLHSVRDAAQILGCGSSTLYAKFISPGLLDVAKIGSATRITDESLQRLVENLVAESRNTGLILPDSLCRARKRRALVQRRLDDPPNKSAAHK